jgi:hypothetical protein
MLTTDLLNAFEKKDTLEIKEIAEKSAVEALINNDETQAQTSILAYALAKIMEKPRIAKTMEWKQTFNEIKEEIRNPSKENLNTALLKIEKLSRDFGRFMIDSVQKARLKTATQIYAHGASIGTSVQLTGADRRELQSYIGQTKIHQKYDSDLKGRLLKLEKLFP